MPSSVPSPFRETVNGDFVPPFLMVRTDSYSPDGGTYECQQCLHREEAPDYPGSCPECDGAMRNIAVPRE